MVVVVVGKIMVWQCVSKWSLGAVVASMGWWCGVGSGGGDALELYFIFIYLKQICT